jgi:hypothetical protein
MRRLSKEEMLFGMEEGKTYAIVSKDGMVSEYKGKFHGYDIIEWRKIIKVCGDPKFGNRWIVYSFETDEIDPTFNENVHGWYFAVEE